MTKSPKWTFSLVILLLIACIYDVAHSLKVSPSNRATIRSTKEFESMKNVEVVGAESGKVVKMGELWNTKSSMFTSEDRAILILFRSFG